jgi:outer membrane protein TolC
MKYCISIIIVLASIWQQGQAQESRVYLTFENVLQLAGAGNLTVQEWQRRYELALAEKKSAAEWWVPSLYGGAMMHQLNGSAMNGDGIFYLDVNRQNFWGGIGANVALDFGNGIFEAAAANQRAIAAQYQSQDEQNKAILAAAEAYFDLQAVQAKVAALGLMAAQSERIAEQLKLQKDAGFTYESDLLMAQSNLNHQKIALQQEQARQAAASLRLVNLLNLDENAGQVVADTNLVAVDLVTEQDVAAAVPGIRWRPSATCGRLPTKRTSPLTNSTTPPNSTGGCCGSCRSTMCSGAAASASTMPVLLWRKTSRSR